MSRRRTLLRAVRVNSTSDVRPAAGVVRPEQARSSSDALMARSARAATVARWFGLASTAGGLAVPAAPAVPDVLRHPEPGTITLITGPSGSGKSSLLCALTGDSLARVTEGGCEPVRWIDVAALPLAGVPVVDCFGSAAPLAVVLTLLGRVGLGEAWTYLRTPAELSDGQRWRLRLALALWNATSGDDGAAPVPSGGTSAPRDGASEPRDGASAPREGASAPRDHISAPCDRPSAPPKPSPSGLNPSAPVPSGAGDPPPARSVVLADEFAALLDRVTAVIVARTLRRMIEAHPALAAVVATSHDDLAAALRPDALVRCDFTTVTVERPQPRAPTNQSQLSG